MGQRSRGKFFRKGIAKLERCETASAARSLLAGIRRERCESSREWYPYTLLLRSRYRDLAAWLKTERPAGVACYAAWWFGFMTGELDALPAAINGMLESEHYFLRVYGVWRWAKRNRISDTSSALAEKTRRPGLTYTMHLEERRANVYLALLAGKRGDAVKTAWANLREYPRQPDCLIDLFEALAASGETEATRLLVKEPAVLRAAKQDLRVLYVVTREHYRLGSHIEAIRGLKILLSEFNHHPLFHHNLGNSHYARGEKFRAIAAWEEASRCAPLFERAWYNAGTLCQSLGDAEHGSSNLREAVRLLKSPDAVYNLSVSLIEQKEMDSAYYHLAKMPDGGEKYGAEGIRAKIRELLVHS